MPVPERYAHIDFRPTAAMRANARRGLRYRRRGGGGGLTTREAGELGIGSGVQRAVQIRTGDKLTPETVRRMAAFFSRHEKNLTISPGKAPWEDRGFVAGLLWGGREGAAWARARVRQMDAADREAGV